MFNSFILDVSHSQVAVFGGNLEEPFNAWTEKHVSQGFSWRPGSVSFAILEEAGFHKIDIEVGSENIDLSQDAMRIIQTPFDVPKNGSIEVASISQSQLIDLPAGSYMLRFEYFRTDSGPRIRFVFIKAENPSFAILRADSGLSASSNDLLLTASPAKMLTYSPFLNGTCSPYSSIASSI